MLWLLVLTFYIFSKLKFPYDSIDSSEVLHVFHLLLQNLIWQ